MIARLREWARLLRERGVLGLNARNACGVLDHNPRSLFPIVDEKSRFQALCDRVGVPTPHTLGLVRMNGEIDQTMVRLAHLQSFVLKPNRGCSGRGILVVVARDPFGGWIRSNGVALEPPALRQHLSDTLAGLYSLGGRPDAVLIQQRIQCHPAFAEISYQGIPDVRVLLYRGEPAMTMLRLPTKQSNGRANLHQGGLGVGVDLQTGMTLHAIQGHRSLARHPDLGTALLGYRVPHWRTLLEMSKRIARAVGLGYLGVDLVLDADRGPLVLEANARPGLAIQLANHAGLIPRLQAIDSQLGAHDTPDGPPSVMTRFWEDAVPREKILG
ncbi:alpha-L-glutamate ligase-like protein [Tuwongella immobilis]|uniref:ATP-grasp domain-containing protein n=1 Tax=Tuwongella immobilis TaxID=692036 RepID=A0A6C2YPT7_9BACT|nr:alpha-L-glutamate ligase-like protein [Tuwongella immobilis]VIP03476.1 alpha-l-glutamate ligase : Uncharacterized protein OS=Cyanothece sp. CCY0110 GN=CY0110_29209 PE=4 SV=1: ATPgrasp_ST [Tuwongella immobilis]VTS04323.1 alpha-l-glutamate ligase : Uncharacterized protein OS=Cyanothece sp. CCY0110 GN=CY0110_29209 PE=4 SV=1: ATPgrasp_ST [Tuwongella immobilis]